MYYLDFTENHFPAITFKELFPRKFINATPLSQSGFLRLFPNKLLTLVDGRHITDLRPGQISKYWGVSSGCAEHARCVKNNILYLVEAGERTFSSLNEIAELKQNVDIFLCELDKEIKENYEQDIYDFIHRFLTGIQENKKIYRGFRHANLDMQAIFTEELIDFPSKLACLMLIASTWYFWDLTATDTISSEDLSTIESLALAILPHRMINQKAQNADSDPEIYKEEIKEKKELSHKQMEKAQAYYRDHDYYACGEICRSLISSGFVDPTDRGLAYYFLVKCRESKDESGNVGEKYTYSGYYDAAKFMRQAISLGCEQARNEWKTLHMDSLLFQPRPSDAPASHIVINSDKNNKRVLSFLKTLPKEMLQMKNTDITKYISYIDTGNTFNDRSMLSKAIYPGEECRYLLLDDNFDKNFNDFLVILNSIKTWKSKNSDSAYIYNDNLWDKTQIFLRTTEEKYAALIDTAIKHMDGISFPIYLIDDAKWAAQSLYAQHPFFYPIRALDQEHLAKNSYTIHLNILTINDDLANWLIREAFWLSCFIYSKLTVNINIFSPHAKDIESRLRFTCKGMWGKISDAEYTSKINITPFDQFQDFNSDQFLAELNKKSSFDESNFTYFIINTGSDISNLNLGIKMRELTISDIIRAGKKIHKVDLPIIAFKCEDPDYAHLSESMVVQMEEHGDSWYNNYALIPFGQLTNRYSFDQLSGGYLEQIAQSAHLQYWGVDPNSRTEETEMLRSDAIEGYFSRCYNRDSSMAVALSIPYRLFQASTNTGLDHILPTGWSITNPFAYSDDLSVKEMADSFKANNNLRDLVLYEHARWVRWAISRGWICASPEETIAYMNSGNPKHQLYISKQHACLCSLDELTQLSEKLYMQYLTSGDGRFADKRGQKKNFTIIDEMNLKHTAEILSTAWFQEKQKDIEK